MNVICDKQLLVEAVGNALPARSPAQNTLARSKACFCARRTGGST